MMANLDFAACSIGIVWSCLPSRRRFPRREKRNENTFESGQPEEDSCEQPFTVRDQGICCAEKLRIKVRPTHREIRARRFVYLSTRQTRGQNSRRSAKQDKPALRRAAQAAHR